MSKLRAGFVLERSLGHTTHADNLRTLLPGEPSIDARLVPIDWDVDGWAAKVPLFNTNWTVRAGLRARRGIRRLRRDGPLDALFIHTQVPAVLAAGQWRRIPTIVSVDATPLQYDELGLVYGHERGNRHVEALKWRANRSCFRRAAHIVAWSSWAKDGVVEGYGIDAGKITVVPPGVTPSVWRRPDAERREGDPLRILFVGGDLERKGGDVLLKAFEALLSSSVGPLELHLVTKAEVPELPGVVVHRGLTPNSPELIALYHRSDVFCLPTRGDCLPMVLSEAGAAGLPLVSTAVAGIPEIVKDGHTGLVVPRDDVDALTRALRRLADDPALRRRLGAEAQELVDRQFDAKKNVSRLVTILHGVAAGQAT